MRLLVPTEFIRSSSKSSRYEDMALLKILLAAPCIVMAAIPHSWPCSDCNTGMVRSVCMQAATQSNKPDLQPNAAREQFDAFIPSEALMSRR